MLDIAREAEVSRRFFKVTYDQPELVKAVDSMERKICTYDRLPKEPQGLWGKEKNWVALDLVVPAYFLMIISISLFSEVSVLINFVLCMPWSLPVAIGHSALVLGVCLFVAIALFLVSSIASFCFGSQGFVNLCFKVVSPSSFEMDGAVLIAIAATIGNLLQGWDNATIAGAVIYIKKEFELQKEPTVEGLIVAMSLIGATIITTFSGPVSDWCGRRPMLVLSSALYFVSGLVMLWSPNVYILLIARLIDGFGVGLAVTLVPVYISETSPPEIRGQLNTLPQFSGSGGMFLSYCMVFAMSLMANPNWRVMLGVLSIPSLLFFALTIFFLPESPRWLVSKGRMVEAKKVLQRLRRREDVAGEMALLVEGLGVGLDTSIEEYIIGPAHEVIDDQEQNADKEQITLYGPEAGLSWVARPVKGQSVFGSVLGSISRHGSSLEKQGSTLVDPLVTLFGSVHENYLLLRWEA
ncbi:hypothetical protein HPP92_022234 [Vanilla planifolia]|uniref:Major facilitator superfamily (MFS) profile domain-containing protein n=1 Tax=Vanilla planifolia TaxID=51239 RepID=A0A835PVB2_VANPL|nr:hypothetical protein HPP92_022234 [Vanilla planifolia]